jgi:GSH-dependent disulfide-bond oxidoreductase
MDTCGSPGLASHRACPASGRRPSRPRPSPVRLPTWHPNKPGARSTPAAISYLADKTGQFISADPNTRYETIQWVMWQMGGVGLLGVLDERLAGRDWVMGADYSTDISLLGWVRNLIGFYEAREFVGFDRFLHIQAWLNRGRRCSAGWK